MKRRISLRLMVALELTALVVFQGCYVEVDGKRYGQQDTAFPGASVERGCVVKIEPGERLFLTNYKIQFRKLDGSNEQFMRYSDSGYHDGKKIEVGKCYEWKMGLGDPSFKDVYKDGTESLRSISSDTLREIDP